MKEAQRFREAGETCPTVPPTSPRWRLPQSPSSASSTGRVRRSFSGYRFGQIRPECRGGQDSRGAMHFGRLRLQVESLLSTDLRRQPDFETPPLSAQASRTGDATWACRRDPATSPRADNGDCISLRRTSFSNSCLTWREEAVVPPEPATAVTARLRASASPWTQRWH